MTTDEGSVALPPKLVDALAKPDAKVFVLTGAGISAESSVPTYRGTGGLYPAGTMIPLQVANARSRRVHELWQQIETVRSGVEAAAPNAAHQALTSAQHAGRPVTVVTQNVDGLHARAGTDAIELHGSLATARCIKPGALHVQPPPSGPAPQGPADVAKCRECGSKLRPNVVLFGEGLRREDVDASHSAALECDVVLAVGTSLQVHPAAGFVELALDQGAVGGWLDLDPATMLGELPSPRDVKSFGRLLAVPGPATLTLPALLSA